MIGISIKNKLEIILAKLPFATRHECNFCGSKIRNFLSYRGGWKNQPQLMKLLDFTGSDVDNFSCPVCGAHDRERHLRMFMDHLNITSKLKDALVLHFAPEKILSDYISKQNPSLYVKADLFPTAPDIIKMDMLDIPYEKNHFDFIIANHVLEHVNDLPKALSEIHRVLKIGGYAILQTPFSSKLQHTIEDIGINTDTMRLELYGQEDHVRLFGNDIFNTITSVGFASHTITHQKVFSETDAKYWGVNILEPFFLFEKTIHD